MFLCHIFDKDHVYIILVFLKIISNKKIELHTNSSTFDAELRRQLFI